MSEVDQDEANRRVDDEHERDIFRTVMGIPRPGPSRCQHLWARLRPGLDNLQDGEYDVFFCQHCLEQKRVYRTSPAAAIKLREPAK